MGIGWGRFRTLVVIVATVTLSGCWAQFRGDAAHTGAQPLEFSLGATNVGDLAVTWRQVSSGFLRAGPTVANGIAYFGASDKKLYAVDAAGACVATDTCARRWTATTGGSLEFGSPAVGDNRVFVGSEDRKIYAFAADGATNCSGTPLVCTPLWSGTTGSPIQSSPTLAGGTVYVTSTNGKLSAFDAAGVTNCTGTPVVCKPLWTTAIGNSSVPAVSDGTVFVNTGSGKLSAFDAVGVTNCTGTPKVCKPLWTALLDGTGNGPPAVADGTVFVPGATTDLRAFDAHGVTNCAGSPKVCVPLWTGTAPGSSVGVAIANGLVYDGGGNGTVSVFDAAGTTNCGGTPTTCTPLWTAATNATTAAPIVANKLLYVSSFDGYLYAFDAEGSTNCSGVPASCAPLWAANGPGGADIAVANGALYAPSAVTTGVDAYQPCIDPVSFAGWAPCDIQNAYRLPSTTGGRGMTVAIVDAHHDPNAEADLAVYRNTFRLPGCSKAGGCFRQVNQLGQTTNYPPADAGWSVEISLDLQMVSAACPNCNILLVEAPNTLSAILQAEDTAVALGADVVSNSYGIAEVEGLAADDSHYDHPGVPIVVASGDDGYAAGPQYPAVIPTVTSVGGTTLARAASGRGWSETVWHQGFNTLIAGSGCSAFETKPAWQVDSGCAHRTDNDVAAVANNLAVYDTYGTPGWITVDGTSASSPIVAAIYALAHGTTGASDLYGGAASLFDVTSGDTGTCDRSYLCTAGVGYDAPTGFGTPCGAGAFGPAVRSPAGCGGPASGSATSLGPALRTGPNPGAVPACRAAPPGGVRCLAYFHA
ncbi:MAG: outer membrane protein assembly factor BamB family protein [Acidimicrobiia bacterium]